MAEADKPNLMDSAGARLLARFTEQTAIRRLARGLTGELLLADHEGDIVDPTLDSRVFTQVPADLLPIRCFDHLFTLQAPAAVIESVDPTSQFAYVHHMHGVRHGEPVPPAILEVTSDDDVTGGINAGLLVIKPDRARFEDMTTRIQRPMPEWGAHHRQLHDLGIRYGFPEQHFLQVEFQHEWIAIDPRFNSMRTDVPHSFGVHWTIGRKPWQNLRNPARSATLTLWAMAWETLRLYHPDICAEVEQRGLVRDKPA